MREARGEEFFHFQHPRKVYWGGVGADESEPGKNYNIGQSFNPYFDFYHQYWGGRAGVTEAERLLAQAGESSGGFSLAPGLVARIVQDLKKECGLVKELVFEEVRREFFSSFPSRQRCMWATPPTEESVRYWNSRVDGEKRWFRVQLYGRIHIASDTYLREDTINVKTLRALAWQYWSGLPGEGQERDEILFEGVVKVVERLEL